MRKPVIAGNWKLYKLLGEARSLAQALSRELAGWERDEVVVAPPFTALAAVAEAVGATPHNAVQVAAQDCYWEKEGAFTGEVSPAMIRDAGARWTIVGHSERRQHFGETDETVARKAMAALAAGLRPIVCVGERLEEREAGRTFEVIGLQIAGGLSGVSPARPEDLVIAYEPVWAIGTGKVATPDQAQEVHAFIRGELDRTLGAGAGERTRILYGGSVKPDNVDGLMAQPDLDGALVGGASLQVDSFLRIVRYR